MRGTPPLHMTKFYLGGIIPAHAGNTLSHRRYSEKHKDHPRTCGEHAPHAKPVTVLSGSSPHMRGTPTCADDEIPWRGIIPAHAGNTFIQHGQRSTQRDHPRTCGEHLLLFLISIILLGSSPHMRGTLSENIGKLLTDGIIPAHAGNTFNKTVQSCKIRDHPRTCGEHYRSRCLRNPDRGSSPHMRGTPRRKTLANQTDGIIPAHAGNTRLRPEPFRRAEDHPRTCGEHQVRLDSLAEIEGSSPHMRGTHEIPALGRRNPGIIPAHAGNTNPRRFQKSPS